MLLTTASQTYSSKICFASRRTNNHDCHRRIPGGHDTGNRCLRQHDALQPLGLQTHGNSHWRPSGNTRGSNRFRNRVDERITASARGVTIILGHCKHRERFLRGLLSRCLRGLLRLSLRKCHRTQSQNDYRSQDQYFFTHHFTALAEVQSMQLLPLCKRTSLRHKSRRYSRWRPVRPLPL